jgi:MYXO-CTERM domain-containing protein
METETRRPGVAKVTPGARGCACELAGDEPQAHAAWLAIGLALAALGRRLTPPVTASL